MSVQVLEPVFPWRAREGNWKCAQEQEDGIAFKGDCKERRWAPATRCEQCVLLQAEQPAAPGQARGVDVPRAPTWAELSSMTQKLN